MLVCPYEEAAWSKPGVVPLFQLFRVVFRSRRPRLPNRANCLIVAVVVVAAI